MDALIREMDMEFIESKEKHSIGVVGSICIRKSGILSGSLLRLLTRISNENDN